MNDCVKQDFLSNNWSIAEEFVIVRLMILFVSIGTEPCIQPWWSNKWQIKWSRHIFQSKFRFVSIFEVLSVCICFVVCIFVVVVIVVAQNGGIIEMLVFTLAVVATSVTIRCVQDWDRFQYYLWYKFDMLKDNKYWMKKYQCYLKLIKYLNEH